MTSVSNSRSGLRIGFFSTVALFAGASAGLAQAPASPFGYTSRIPSVGFQNVGFQNVGFRNAGFQNVGFQNVGFRNSSLSVTGVGSSYTGPGLGALPSNYIGPSGQYGPSLPNIGNNGGYNAAPQQYGTSLSSAPQGVAPQGMPGSYYVPADDTASITVGPGTNLTSGFSMPSISRGARYTVGLGFDSPVGTTNPRLSQELQSQFANSQRFNSGKNISVAVENNVVVLRGKVADAHERDLAEMFVRLSPGVYDVRNDLQIGDDVAAVKQ